MYNQRIGLGMTGFAFLMRNAQCVIVGVTMLSVEPEARITQFFSNKLKNATIAHCQLRIAL